jgi:hypothetical protein
VSSDIWRVDLPGRSVCVKRARPVLAVAAEWQAPVERNESEVAWLEVAGEIHPSAVPRVFGQLPDLHLFVMEHLDPAQFPVGKGELAAGRVTPGQDVALSLDIAASQFYRDGLYTLASEDRTLDGDGLSELLLGWLERYPIAMIEDPLVEHDREGFVAFTRAAGDRVQIVGDDYLVTSAERVRAAAKDGACNAVLVKPNQAGTLTEARAALTAARETGFGAIVSARSGESEDTTIVHLAVGWGALQLKVGSITRSERTAKWNEGLRIAEVLGNGGPLPSPKNFPWGASSR